MKTTNSKIFAYTSAIALALLFTVANATALTHPTTNPVAPAAKALTGPTTLTPAAPVTSPAPPAGEDIRDIRQPRHFPTPWLWVMVAAGVSTLIVAAWLVWRWLRAGRLFEMSPAEITLQRLEESRRLMDPAHAREYCFAVSQIIRGYIEEQLRLRAPRLTTEEFLRELVEGRAEIVATHRALLGDFLQHCDLAKFAGWRYSLEALADMHVSAIEFVQQSSVAPTPTTIAKNSTDTTSENILVKQQ